MGRLVIHRIIDETERAALAGAACRLHIFQGGSDTLCPVFADSNLTFSAENPVPIPDIDAVPVRYLPEGSYRAELRALEGALLLAREMTIGAGGDAAVAHRFAAMEDLRRDRVLSYGDGADHLRVAEADLVEVASAGFCYRVAAPDAADHAVETAGGVRLEACTDLSAPQSVVRHGLRFDGAAAEAELQAALDAAARETRAGAREVVVRGGGRVPLGATVEIPSKVRLVVDSDVRFAPLVEDMTAFSAKGAAPATTFALTGDAARDGFAVRVGPVNIAAFAVGDDVWIEDLKPIDGSPNSNAVPQAQMARVVAKTAEELILDRPLEYDFTVADSAAIGVATVLRDVRLENVTWGGFDEIRGGVGFDFRYHDGLLMEGLTIRNTRSAADPDNAFATLNQNGISLRHCANTGLQRIRGASLGWYLLSLDGACHNVTVRDIRASIARHCLSVNWNGPGEPVHLLVENGSAHRCTFAGFDTHDVGRDITFRKLRVQGGLNAGIQMRGSHWLVEDCDILGNAGNGFVWRAEDIAGATGDAAHAGQTKLAQGVIRNTRIVRNGGRGLISQGPLVAQGLTVTDNGASQSLTEAGGVHLPSGRISDSLVARNNGAAFRVPPTNTHPEVQGRVDISGGVAPHDAVRQTVLVSGPTSGFGATPVVVRGLEAQGYPAAAVFQRDGGYTSITGVSLRDTRFGSDASAGSVLLVAGEAVVLNDNIRAENSYSDGRFRSNVAVHRIEKRSSAALGQLTVLVADGQLTIKALTPAGAVETGDVSRIEWTIL
jgi:hypothetical protein